MEKETVASIDAGHYTGRNGAVASSARNLMGILSTSADDKADVVAIMGHINVLYSAMSFHSKGGVVSKAYGFLCAMRMAYWLLKVEGYPFLKAYLDAGGWHVIMSAWARLMQIARMLRVIDLVPSLRHTMYKRMISSYNRIGEIASIQARTYDATDSEDLSPARRLHLLGATLLYELSLEGLYKYPFQTQVEDLRHRVMRFCRAREHIGFKGREEVQLVCRLLRAIGRHEEATKIAERHGTTDQLVKAM
jgi:hypothetical protein